MLGWWRVLLAGWLACLLWAGPARAGDDSEALFHSGVDAFERRDYRAAAVLFERAFAQSGLGPASYNAGMSWKLASEDARAADALSVALERGDLDPAQRSQATAAYAELRTRLAEVRLRGPETTRVSVAHRDRVALPTRIHLPPGAHALVVHRRDGGTERQVIRALADSSLSITIPALEPEAPVAVPQVGERGATDEPVSGAVPWGWVFVGGGVVALGAGTYFQLSALADRDRWDELGHRREHEHVRERAQLKNRVAIGSFVGAAALAVTGVTLLLAGPGTERRPQAGVALAVEPRSIVLHGQF